MELKNYQKQVINDLADYLESLNEHGSLSNAFSAHWKNRQIQVGGDGITPYCNVVKGVPHVCFKVPTGGGKTFLACASIKPIFDARPPVRNKAVVWLVPSESILTQTLKALKNPAHPYRQKLNADFGGRVEVYSKEELLVGQNFSPATVAEQLSVMVLSYDSFRANRKEGRKAYQANGNLERFATAFGTPEQPIANADETALFQVINQLNPIVIVDESHHATSTLSHEMLVNFNPSFILDLTATPTKQANVISYVDALTLKHEHMVKLPVIAYNRNSRDEVVTAALDLQRSLEATAQQQQKAGGRYIRPIVLFQAQPKTNSDATTFEKIREQLIAVGVDAAQIAVKTAEINELKGVDLLSPDCEIRYIITVNALKEGWDCPFAYILASLANRTSRVDVEQILGRVLRQPHARQQDAEVLNYSYVLTSSADFNATLENIIAGLNVAGFTKHDFRAVGVTSDDTTAVLENLGAGAEQLQFSELDGLNTNQSSAPEASPEDTNNDNEWDFNAEAIAAKLAATAPSTQPDGTTADERPSAAATILAQAQRQGATYNREVEQAARDTNNHVPTDLRDKVNNVRVFDKFLDDIQQLTIPQFVVTPPPSGLFSLSETGTELLTSEALCAGFTLRDKDIELDLSTVDEQMYRLDVENPNDVARAFHLTTADQHYMREVFSKLDIDAQRRNAAEFIYDKIKPIDPVADGELRDYITRITSNFDATDIAAYQERTYQVAEKIRKKILGLLTMHKDTRFYDDIEIEAIQVEPRFKLPELIHPVDASSVIGGSLYEAEDAMNSLEYELASRLSGMANVRWWHRNLERKGFFLNGPINHYPDFIVQTEDGACVLVETKGEQLKNEDSKIKLRLGKKWEALAGRGFRYYMVFHDDVTPLDNAVTMSKFLSIIERL
ncbi:DEAD/DEAH box helicase [Corynebacterium aquilae]|uniref:Restriction endonuclease n=1 Tax=Corynebacterium aquilae DSM 44791 TaxID=1431546 RepID=A0A1L7CEJ0_9CORY|nr:DEAD/DEAH box helicase family protein [Corynebacterium aquilae]APT84247.1 restriction endonuclease [Corynebacterium aquilae DSM 44791]